MANPTNPILLTPTNNETVYGNVLIFTFYVPTDTDNDKLVFRIELDKNNPINISSPNYKKNESRFAIDSKIQGKWEVKNISDEWELIPTGGIGTDYYGKEAKITIRSQDTINYPSSNGYWYWQVSCGDGIAAHPLFNQFIFAQGRFG